ncbi:hypothetical protein [Anabaena catenula]|uniref:Flagellar assembly protein H n=1 Tax=Anabaena catenula FACHB-362 TaxID=2692877 RepID=A0ABR8J995_9NOST|nr:hypothetical protein [Anabaena catenula]MBD2694252.1 hypothetical protein [Anabaena catenula FACHB-362]
MTRQQHDQFAKQYLEELLSPLGKVEVSREVTDEVRQVDIFFSPVPSPTVNPQSLGLLGRIAASTALLEPFRNQPSKTEVRNCIIKLFSVYGELQRKAKRENTSLPEGNLPSLWVFAPSASTGLLESFGAKLDLDNWLPGVFFLPDAFKTAIVAINQLPVTDETLLCRLLGRGKVQQEAVKELVALPPENPLRHNILELVFSWRVSVQTQEILTEDDQELIMMLTEAYQKARAEAVQEGVQQGQRLVLENLLRAKFGNLDDELSRIMDNLLNLPTEEYTRLCLQLSREELLARFNN